MGCIFIYFVYIWCIFLVECRALSGPSGRFPTSGRIWWSVGHHLWWSVEYYQ